MDPEPALYYVAEKWFGFSETEQHRIFVENPAFYVVARAELMEHPGTGGFSLKNILSLLINSLCSGSS